jgi:GNAT superfamily N-acetyltransferase
MRRVATSDEDFGKMVRQLTTLLSELNGEADSFYASHNSLDTIPNGVVAYMDGLPVGCGAFRVVNATTVEVKRMFVSPDVRRKGVAGAILAELERWAQELGFEYAVLETSRRLDAAVSLYEARGYAQIANYEPYVGIEDSVCYEKSLGHL